MNKEDTIKSDEIVKHTLDLLICEKQFGLDGVALKNLRVDRIQDYARNTLLYSLHTLLPAENIKEETHTVTVKYPETWWQMFKEQYFPTWLKEKCPIKYGTNAETIKFTAYNLYPKFPSFMPERCEGAVRTIYKTRE